MRRVILWLSRAAAILAFLFVCDFCSYYLIQPEHNALRNVLISYTLVALLHGALHWLWTKEDAAMEPSYYVHTWCVFVGVVLIRVLASLNEVAWSTAWATVILCILMELPRILLFHGVLQGVCLIADHRRCKGKLAV